MASAETHEIRSSSFLSRVTYELISISLLLLAGTFDVSLLTIDEGIFEVGLWMHACLFCCSYRYKFR